MDLKTIKGLEDIIYARFTKEKDKRVTILSQMLTGLQIHANHITLLGVICMILFIQYVQRNLSHAALFLLASILCDMLDGAVARYQKKDSDRGKFIDMVSDNFNTFLFSIGAFTINPSIFIVSYAYLMLLSKVARVYIYACTYTSDWLFKAVAGFIPNAINHIGYAMVLATPFCYNIKELYSWFFAIASLILLCDAIFYINKILKNEVSC